MFYFKDDNQVTVYFADGNSAVWKNDSPSFTHVIDLCVNAKWIEIQHLYNQNKMVIENEVTILDDNTMRIVSTIGSIDVPMNTNTPLVKFIKLLREKGVVDQEITRIKPFLINMFQNPYIDAVQEIYDYCTKMDFEITEDGCFLAYKNVNEDLSSIWDNGQTKHTIGEYTEVTDFDTDRNRTCSKGLHFCSRGYLEHYSGDTTIVVKVNPKDVVSIPTDYNFEKGRCKRYYTVGILGKNGTLQTTNIEAMSNNTVKTVKTDKQRMQDTTTAKNLQNRIVETATLMQRYDNNVRKVANIMNISMETVKRNMRKYRSGTN